MSRPPPWQQRKRHAERHATLHAGGAQAAGAFCLRVNAALSLWLRIFKLRVDAGGTVPRRAAYSLCIRPRVILSRIMKVSELLLSHYDEETKNTRRILE